MSGDELKFQRQRIGLTPEDLARLTGVNVSMIDRWESGISAWQAQRTHSASGRQRTGALQVQLHEYSELVYGNRAGTWPAQERLLGFAVPA